MKGEFVIIWRQYVINVNGKAVVDLATFVFNSV